MFLRCDFWLAGMSSALTLLGASVPLVAQEVACRPYEVAAQMLNISRDAGGETYIDVLEHGEIVCVTQQALAGGAQRGLVNHKLSKSGAQVAVNGWVSLRYLRPLPPSGPAAGSDPPKLPTAAQPPPAPSRPPSEIASAGTAHSAQVGTQAAAQAPQSPSSAASVGPAAPPRPADSEDVVTFDQPIPFGPVPVNGNSLRSLSNGVPLFSPLEGLDEAKWQIPCSSCHKWDQAKLCDQGSSYARSPKAVLRHPHPYGGAFKIALMRWARHGCS